MTKKQNTSTIIGKDELIHQVAAKAGMTLKDTNAVIDAFLHVVKEQISQGHAVRLIGFGMFHLRPVAARSLVSIRNKEKILTPAGTRVAFSVGDELARSAQEYEKKQQ